MSLLKANSVQVGQSATASQNFVVTTGVNGTAKIARGNSGATTQDLITVSAAGNVQLTKTNEQSMVRLNTANGYGSTNTKIRRFTNVMTNQGTDITYADSATLGATFTISTAGVYAISYVEGMSASGTSGVSLNTSQPTTIIYNLPASEVLVFMNGTPNPACSWTGYLPAGSVVRPHTDGTGASSVIPQFTIVRVS